MSRRHIPLDATTDDGLSYHEMVADPHEPAEDAAVSRAIELALKTFLLLKGETTDTLKYDIGHDLANALDRAKSLGLASVYPLSEDSDAAVRWIGLYYKAKHLEYPTIGYKEYPEFQYLETFASELLQALAPLLRTWRPRSSLSTTRMGSGTGWGEHRRFTDHLGQSSGTFRQWPAVHFRPAGAPLAEAGLSIL